MRLSNNDKAKLGKLIDAKHPIFGSKKIEEIKGKNNTLDLYDYPLDIECSSKEEFISILFVGQSGTGKSTFINAYVNHLLGITKNDDIRYKLILGDKSKEKGQTKSQTDNITIYNVRSTKYNNKLFKLIDTPGAGDTRNDNENNISKIEQDQKEKELLTMYNDLFSKYIGQLNSITIVAKSSENRENEFQKKIIKSITNLFAGDIDKNCLAVLTHPDDDEEIPDAVRLLEKMDIFKKKSDNNEEWYFPVSSKSYFIPFKKGKSSVSSEQFDYTKYSFEKYTKKLLSLKLYYTKQTQKYLELKEQQEKIIKVLKDDIIDYLFTKIKQLEGNKVDLDEKITECKDKQREIEEIKKQINHENDLRKQIEKNYNTYITSKKQKEDDLKENNEKIKSLNLKKTSIDTEIQNLDKSQKQAEKDKKDAEEKQKELDKEIKNLENEIKIKETQIDDKVKETIETKEIKQLKERLQNTMNTINSSNVETDEMKKIKQCIQNSINNINNINLEDKREKEIKKKEEEKEKITQEQLKKEKELKDLKEKQKKEVDDLKKRKN